MKVHLIDTHLLVPRSRSSAKVKVKYQGHVSQKMGVSGAVEFHKHILFVICLLSLYTIAKANEVIEMNLAMLDILCFSVEVLSAQLRMLEAF